MNNNRWTRYNAVWDRCFELYIAASCCKSNHITCYTRNWNRRWPFFSQHSCNTRDLLANVAWTGPLLSDCLSNLCWETRTIFGENLASPPFLCPYLPGLSIHELHNIYPKTESLMSQENSSIWWRLDISQDCIYCLDNGADKHHYSSYRSQRQPRVFEVIEPQPSYPSIQATLVVSFQSLTNRF